MGKDCFWCGTNGEHNNIHEECPRMQAIDVRIMLIIERKRRSGYEKI